MASSKRDRFEREREKLGEIDDPPTRAALREFADALDPENHHEMVPKPRPNGTIEHESKSNSTGTNYLGPLRLSYDRGLDLLSVDADTVNDFMRDLVTEPEKRRYDLVDHDGSIGKPAGKTWQAAFRAFYRYCTEPGVADERPDVNVGWPADSIIMFTKRSEPAHDEADLPQQADLDALREACVDHSYNTRRDRAFVELAAGTGQRVYALLTLKIKHVHPRPDDGVPHILLNPEIKNDGDKGAIANTGRWKPIVTDPGPVARWIENHPLRDPEVRAEHGAPSDFEDCYLFIGDVGTSLTDASTHWHQTSPLEMLKRRKANTREMPTVKTVDVPVNPHNWRHYAYTKSQELPIDESTRRKVFGWAPGSDTGQTVYGHTQNEDAGREFAEAWQEAFGDAEIETVAEQVVGDVAGGDFPPEVRKALVQQLINDDTAMDRLAESIAAAE